MSDTIGEGRVAAPIPPGFVLITVVPSGWGPDGQLTTRCVVSVDRVLNFEEYRRGPMGPDDKPPAASVVVLAPTDGCTQAGRFSVEESLEELADRISFALVEQARLQTRTRVSR